MCQLVCHMKVTFMVNCFKTCRTVSNTFSEGSILPEFKGDKCGDSLYMILKHITKANERLSASFFLHKVACVQTLSSDVM